MSTNWQELASHGEQKFYASDSTDTRKREVEAALADICDEIHRVTGDRSSSGLTRCLAIRSRPVDDERSGASLYECMNQLIHYWHCCIAARDLLVRGCRAVTVMPTAVDSQGIGVPPPFDLDAQHPALGRIIGEVFCVSESLWRQKVRRSSEKFIQVWFDDAVRVIYYNLDAKPIYRPKTDHTHFYGIRADESISPIYIPANSPL